MHREIYEHLEDVLSGSPPDLAARHLQSCAECRDEVGVMRAQAKLVQQLKAPADLEPRAGFYARVLERIEAEGPVSIWNLFVESAFGRRIAVASVALALVLSVYLVSSERTAEPIVADSVQVCVGPACDSSALDVVSTLSSFDVDPIGAASAVGAMAGPVVREDAPGAVLTHAQESPNDDMLVNLVTYREQ
jgi:predicted anti-sigma-YlaC factor YlaD